MTKELADLAWMALGVVVTAAVSGLTGWLVSALRTQRKIDAAVTKLETAIGRVSGSLAAYKASHANAHVALEAQISERFTQLVEEINDVANSARDSVQHLAKEAALAQAILSFNSQARDLGAAVARLEGCFETWTQLDAKRRP